ncbi:unnamed protein product [Cyprideis torosa]|uniref:Uncharacterized protein n=1 Tax=Cyprideis torosa TaxID=163714 RepID=A0A7R8WPA8_9CRUS|nr:unnamed protein product [Cyprideis torosa]CAG0907126.1 unnamed protein product [Cyprideis torosa]
MQNRIKDAEINLKELESEYRGNSSLLSSIELEIKTAKDQMNLNRTNYQRYQRLWSQGIGKRVDLEQAELAYKTSQNQVRNLEKKLEQTRNDLRNRYDMARNRLSTEKEQLRDFEIRSEIDGVIYALNKEEGEYITAQDRFAEIGGTGDYVIQMNIDEEDISKINLGDTVVLDLDAYPNEVYTARIQKIFPKKDEVTQTFLTEGSFVQAPSKLYNGLSGEANIIVSKREKALTIPSDYLMSGNMVQTEDGSKKVKIGVRNIEFVEIMSGIDSSTLILKPTEE